MKKTISALLLFSLMLWLCACSEATSGIAEAWESGMNGTGSLTIAKEEPEDAVKIPPTAIRLHVSFGPEFEVVMTDYLRILQVNPENAEAEALLEGLKLVDRSYCFAFDEVLAAAQEQGYLKIGNTIKMTADSLDASVWTNASKELLMRPVDTFRKETGALFGCNLFLPDAAEAIQLDFSLLTKVERTTEEGYNMYYPTGAVSGNTQWRSVWNYNDGRTEEYYAFAIKGGNTNIYCNLDGVWDYCQVNANSMNRVWEGPDFYGYSEEKGREDPNTGRFISESSSGFESFEGRGCSFEETYSGEGILASRIREYLDGSYETATCHDNGELHTREYKGADGTYESSYFYPDGNMESMKRETAEGYYEEQRAEDGKFVYQKFADAGMTNLREVFYTDGKPVKVIIDGVVHEDQEMLSQFG